MKAKDKLNEYCRLDINQLTHKDLNTYSLKLSTIIEAMEEYAESQLQALKEDIENEMIIEEPESDEDRWTNFVIEGVLDLITNLEDK